MRYTIARRCVVLGWWAVIVAARTLHICGYPLINKLQVQLKEPRGNYIYLGASTSPGDRKATAAHSGLLCRASWILSFPSVFVL